MLYPLVESCLPEELLRVWQRSPNFAQGSTTVRNRLNDLMTFLKNEVESEERIALAIEGFGISTTDNKSKKLKPKPTEVNFPTASGLLNTNFIKCLFCEGAHHSENCFKAQKMTLTEKRDLLSKKRACFMCLKVGHQSRNCRERLRCPLCSRRHVILMCYDLPSNKKSSEFNQDSNQEQNESVDAATKDKALANHTETPVFLQTLRVKLRSDSKEKEVRAIIDTGSQRSYILKSTAELLKYQCKRSENLIHALFGGCNSSQQEHKCYEARVASLDGNYACKFDTLDQPIICKNIPAVHDGVWMRELSNLNISLTDIYNSEPIELLIGADVAGRLLTGQKHVLQCGIVAIQTFFGWTLLGKVPEETVNRSMVMTCLSLLTKDVVADLWKLDTLGISDPVEKRSKQEAEALVKEHFLETVVVDEKGRYEVEMPWVDEHPPLPRNFNMAERRLEYVVEKLKKEDLYEGYQKVFDEWLEEKIIETVPQEEIANPAHYMPHRPVIKWSSLTSKIRPVFDASACEKNFPSLNHCLEIGENLIELIPTILNRFRLYQYGIVPNICKAFLQIGVCKKDRDYLRFLWMTKDGSIVHLRHNRVVFGVCSSPFLLGVTIQYHLNRMLARCELSECTYSKNVILKLMSSFYVDNCITSVSSEEDMQTFQEQASQIMAEGNFDLRGWETTNIEKIEKSSPLLGMKWNQGEDTLSINGDNIKDCQIEKITKREMLSLVQRIFNQIGLCAPLLCIRSFYFKERGT